jgi:uncharacterized Zn finger protein
MGRYDYYGFAPYVSVAQKKINAEKLAAKLSKKGDKLEPVSLTGTKLTTTFWGQSWNANLEQYRDFENRLPRGRSYLRHGAVIDLKVKAGVVDALVSGSSLYKVNIKIKSLESGRWKNLKKECSGKITSLIGLLQGKLPAPVMEAVTREKSGLFPEPKDITFQCSCPDYAGICKHVAAVVYGIGARLDHQPELLFTLRGVDHLELITEAGDVVAGQAGDGDTGVVFEDISGIFGIDLDDSPAPPAAAKAKATGKKKIAKKTAGKKVAKKAVASPKAKKTTPAIKKAAATPQKAAKKVVKKSAKKVAKPSKTRRTPN